MPSYVKHKALPPFTYEEIEAQRGPVTLAEVLHLSSSIALDLELLSLGLSLCSLHHSSICWGPFWAGWGLRCRELSAPGPGARKLEESLTWLNSIRALPTAQYFYLHFLS